MAICLPGMESRVKRAATSAMRDEPRVTTTKFTITRIAKTMTPMTKLPCIISSPKAWMMWPAPSVPSWPWPRISRVEAMFSPRRNSVATSSTVGKAVNSSGFLISSEVIRIRTELVIEIASSMSSMKAGIGRISRTMIPTMPRASATSPRATQPQTSRALGADRSGGKGKVSQLRAGPEACGDEAADVGDGRVAASG